MAEERTFKFWHYADDVNNSIFPKVILEGTEADGLSSVVGEFPLEPGEVAIAGIRQLLYTGTDGADGAFFLDLFDGTIGYFSDSQDLSLNDSIPLQQFTEEPLPLDPDQETDAPIISIVPEVLSQNEGDDGTTAFEFEVTREGGDLEQELTLAYRVVGSGSDPAKLGEDFIGLDPAGNGQVTFEAGASTAVITVDVVGDTIEEANEGFTVNLFNPDNSLGATASATITNDDQAPVLSITDLSQAEGNEGTTLFTVTVTRDGETGGTSTVNWNATTSIDDNGVKTDDFVLGQLTSGILTFAPDEKAKDITFEVVGDTVVELDETFTVTLSDPDNAALNPDATEATVTIENDDTELVLTIEAVEAAQPEGDSGTTPFEFVVTRAGGDLTQALDVDYRIGGDIGADDIDGPFTGTVRFEPDASTAVITVNVVGDIVVETDEALQVQLINPDLSLGATASATITNDDQAPVLSITDLSQAEGNEGTTLFTVTVTRDGET
ncbi:MAG: Calx-beta domain-containing protein, partial [Actinomycetota bacterium]|nr:Calx-beta domain-containing protein [Actinomycetota bacterium]